VRPSALVFDVDDTLYDLAAPYRAAYKQIFATRYNLPVDELFKMSRVHSDRALELLTAGSITPEDHKVLRVQWTFADWGVDVSREEALAFQDAYAAAQERITPYPEALTMLRATRDAHVPLGLISNGDAPHQLRKLHLLGIDRLVDPEYVVISGDLGVNKPDVALFREAERRLDVHDANIWYVGDTYETDVVGAKRAGWKSLWLDVRGRPVPEVPERPDLTVHSLPELERAVTALLQSAV
jgi:putative hydrolase of the HAD superfamily